MRGTGEIQFCDIGISHFGFEFNRKIKQGKKKRNRKTEIEHMHRFNANEYRILVPISKLENTLECVNVR